MCNSIATEYSESTAIPEEGLGWKLFSQLESGDYVTLVHEGYYEIKEGWINWKYEPDQGFCFFLDKEEAERAMAAWKGRTKKWKRFGKVVLKKIGYKKGKVTRKERHFITGLVFQIAICQEFQIVEE